MNIKSRFTELGEFYKAIDELVKWLGRDGHIEESRNLGVAMAAGATSSEILGDIMLALRNMKGKYAPGLKKEIDECFAFARHHRKILGLDGRRGRK